MLRKFPPLICALLLFVLAACSQPPQEANPNPNELAGLIAVEVAGIGSDDMSARAYGDPAPDPATLSAQALDEERSIRPRDLTLLSLDTFTVGERGEGGLRYLSATFEVTNNSDKTFENLTLLGVGTQNSQAGTPLRNVRKRRGGLAGDDIVRAMKPIHGMRFDATQRAPIVQNDMANFQAYSEDELPQAPFIRDNIQQYFPYGFVVEDSDPNDGTRALEPGEKGIVTFSYALPLQARAVDDPFSFSVTFQAVDDDSVRVTESVKEQGKSSAEARARTLNAELVLLGNSATSPSTNLSVKRVCILRTAGTAEDPQAFLINDTEGACVNAGQDPSTPGDAPENPDGTRLFVDANAPTDGDGESWANAFTHLQDALKKGSDEGIFELWIADGSYFPDESEQGAAEDGDVSASFTPQGDFVLLGGFAGGETNPEARDPEANLTVLSGDIDGNPSNLTASENVVVVLVGTSVVIDGVTVTQGRIGATSEVPGGAGILNSGELQLRSSVVVDNSSDSQNARGGGILNNTGASLTLDKTEVLDNSNIGDGGGIADFGNSLTLIDSEISNNKAVSGTRSPLGGGLLHNSEGAVKIVRSTFSENEATLNGGGITSIGGTFEIIDSFVLNNKAIKSSGGGLDLDNSNAEGIKIVNTLVSGNEASAFGGGVQIDRNAFEDKDPAEIVAVISNSTFSNNRAGADGGGLSSAQGVRMVNSIVTGNTSGVDGGGLSLTTTKLVINDTSITNNSAGENGGGVRVQGDTSILRTTIAGNTAVNGGGIAFENTFRNETFTLEQSTLSSNDALGVGGGLFLNVQEQDSAFGGPKVKVHNSLIVNNRAQEGGGIFHDLGKAEARNVTITGNVAQTGGGVFAKKGAFLPSKTQFFLGNSIVTDNRASNPTTSGDLHGVRLKPDNDTALTSIQVNRVLLGGAGNTGVKETNGTLIGVNPQFVSPNTGDFSLKAGSPAVDAGATGAMSLDNLDTDGDGDTREFAPQDFAGNTRVVGEAVDMGAFERQ